MSKLMVAVAVMASASAYDPHLAWDLIGQQGGVVASTIKAAFAPERLAGPLGPLVKQAPALGTIQPLPSRIGG